MRMYASMRARRLDGPMEIGHWRGRGEKSILDIRSLCSLTYSRSLASSVRAAPPSRRSVINDSSDESYLKKVFLVQQNRKCHISAMRLQLSECECGASDERPSRSCEATVLECSENMLHHSIWSMIGMS